MKKYILIGCLSLLGSAYAMDRDLTPEEKREIRARAAENRLRLQQSGQIEGENIQENDEKIISEDEKEGIIEEEEMSEGEEFISFREQELISMAERIQADQKFVQSIINSKEPSECSSLQKKCLDVLSNPFITDGKTDDGKRLKVVELLENPNNLLDELQEQLILSTLSILEPYQTIYDSDKNYWVSFYFLKYSLLNYRDNVLHNELDDAKKLLQEDIKLISSLPYYKKLSREEKRELRYALKQLNIVLPVVISDIFSMMLPKVSNGIVPPFTELIFQTLISEFKLGFINVDKVIKLLDKLPLELKLKLMKIITKNESLPEDKLNFEICSELFWSILAYNDFKAKVRANKYNPELDKWDYKKMRQEAAPVFLYYQTLPSHLKRQLKGFLLGKFGADIVDDVFSCRFYPPIKRLLYNHGIKTSYLLGLVGSYTGLLLASNLLQTNNQKLRLAILPIGMICGYRLATIPLYDWDFFDYYTPNLPGLNYELCKILSGMGALGGVTLYYFASKFK